MYYIVETEKEFEQASQLLELTVKSNGFGVLHIHDLGKTLRDKGIEFKEQCRIFEVCNPGHAAKVLETDMNLNMALPCRISIFTDKGKTKIGLIRPQEVLSSLSSDPTLKEVAKEVEKTTIKIIDETK